MRKYRHLDFNYRITTHVYYILHYCCCCFRPATVPGPVVRCSIFFSFFFFYFTPVLVYKVDGNRKKIYIYIFTIITYRSSNRPEHGYYTAVYISIGGIPYIIYLTRCDFIIFRTNVSRIPYKQWSRDA